MFYARSSLTIVLIVQCAMVLVVGFSPLTEGIQRVGSNDNWTTSSEPRNPTLDHRTNLSDVVTDVISNVVTGNTPRVDHHRLTSVDNHVTVRHNPSTDGEFAAYHDDAAYTGQPPVSFVVTKIVTKIVNYAVPPLALVGNGLSLVVFVRMVTSKQQILAVFIVISVVDTFSLSDNFDLMVMFFVGNYWSLNNWNFSCKLMKWIGFTSQVCSSYYVLLFTVERFISVRFPLKRAVIWSKGRTNIAIVVILLTSALSMAYNIHFWVSPMHYCRVDWPLYETYNTVQICIFYVIGLIIPYSAVAVFNGLILHNMIQHRAQRATMTTPAATGADEKAQRSLTRMLVVVSSYSLLFNLPRIVTQILAHANPNSDSEHAFLFGRWANDIIGPFNYCGSFFFYILSGRQFRQELVRLFCRRQPIAGGLTDTTARVVRVPPGNASGATTATTAVKMQSH